MLGQVFGIRGCMAVHLSKREFGLECEATIMETVQHQLQGRKGDCMGREWGCILLS